MLRTRWQPYLYLAPAAVLLLAFSIYPLLHAGQMSLYKNWGKPTERFVGLENYKTLLGEGEFWKAFGVSVWYAVGTVPIALVLGFLLANLLFQKLRCLGLYRTIYFLPYVTSTVAAAMVWRWIFAPSSRGVANTVLGWLGVGTLRWYKESTGVFALAARGLGIDWPGWAGGPSLALVCVMVFAVWHTLGFNIVVFLAGLSAIPREMGEAAEVDGAGAVQRVWYVTLPLLTPTLFFLAIISTIRSFQTFNQIYVMTYEQSAGSTQNLTMLIFNHFWDKFHYGMATASAMLLFVIILALTAFQMRVLGPRVHY